MQCCFWFIFVPLEFYKIYKAWKIKSKDINDEFYMYPPEEPKRDSCCCCNCACYCITYMLMK